MKKNILHITLQSIALLLCLSLAAESVPDSSKYRSILYRAHNAGYSSASGWTSLSGNPKKIGFRSMRYSGWARFYPYYRHMKSYYDIPPTEGLTLPITINANDGYQQPMMLLRMEATPSAKTWFQSELQFDHLLKRTTYRTNSDGRFGSLFVIFNLQGGVDTRFGKFKMTAGGGANWYRLSPFTLWGYQYRDDMFERYPWEPEGHDFARYNSFYSIGDIPRDQRFGMQATQGFILEATNLPAGFDVAILHGKTSNNAYQSYIRKDATNMIATRIGKTEGNHKFGYNYFNQYGYVGNKVLYLPVVKGVDTFYVEDNFTSQAATSVDARLQFDGISFFAETGIGSYCSNLYNDSLKKNAKPGIENVSRYKKLWDEMLFVEISTKRKITYIPLRLQLYRISKYAVSNTNNITNTSIEKAKQSIETPDEYYINYYDGFVPEMGQLATNRQGFTLIANKEFFYNKIKTKTSLSIAQEIENLAGDVRNGGRAAFVAGTNADSTTRVPFTNSITFEHKLNGLTRSRFAFYKRFQGPYARLHSIFRRSFENIAITDTIIDYKKSFSTMEMELKYKFKLLSKEIIVSGFNNYTSVQDHWSLPVFSEKAFLRYLYTEWMAFYNIHPKVTLVAFAGMEKVWGNHRMELADSTGNLITDAKGRPIPHPDGKPVRQTGHGYGAGLDYNFHTRASVNIRHRWFNHKDKHFLLDQFKGNEMTVELKIFF